MRLHSAICYAGITSLLFFACLWGRRGGKSYWSYWIIGGVRWSVHSPKLGGEEKEKMNWWEDHPIFFFLGRRQDHKSSCGDKKSNPNYLVVLFTFGTPTPTRTYKVVPRKDPGDFHTSHLMTAYCSTFSPCFPTTRLSKNNTTVSISSLICPSVQWARV